MTGPKKILVVDDDPYILMSLEFLMKKNGYDVMVARNGTEALDIVEKQIPDIVLLDIMMPDVDGYEICGHIRHTAKLKHTKVFSANSGKISINFCCKTNERHAIFFAFLYASIISFLK